MPIRGIEPESPIERIADIEREGGSVEHDKRNKTLRRPKHHHEQKETVDRWCGHDGEGEEQESEDTGEQVEEERSPSEGHILDYKA